MDRQARTRPPALPIAAAARPGDREASPAEGRDAKKRKAFEGPPADSQDFARHFLIRDEFRRVEEIAPLFHPALGDWKRADSRVLFPRWPRNALFQCVTA